MNRLLMHPAAIIGKLDVSEEISLTES